MALENPLPADSFQQRYQLLAKVAPVGIAHTTADGQCVYVNERWCELTGFTVAAALGEGWARAVHPEDRAAVLAAWQHAVQTRGAFQREFRYQRPDGRVVWVLGQVAEERDAAGQISGYVGVLTDITERKSMEVSMRQLSSRMEELVQARTAELAQANAQLQAQVDERNAIAAAMRTNSAMLRTVIDSTPDWIFIKDLEFRFLLANRSLAQIFNCTPEDFIGKDDLEMGHPRELVLGDPAKGIRGYRADDREVMESGQPKVIEAELALVHGHHRILNTVKVPLRDGEGRVCGLLGYVRDITEIKEASAERERLITELQAALIEVKTLSGLLPVCGWCKKIRDDSGYWNSVEGYLKKSSGVDITHGICPDCSAKVMVDMQEAAGASPDAPSARQP
jgi:PAS domain S-box-containing protein